MKFISNRWCVTSHRNLAGCTLSVNARATEGIIPVIVKRLEVAINYEVVIFREEDPII